MMYYYLPPIVFFVSLLFLYLLYRDAASFTKRWFERKLIFENYVVLMSIVEEAKQIAYEKLYQDDIVVYSASGYRTNLQDIQRLQKRYIELIVSFVGPRIVEDLKNLYGNEEAVYGLLITYFNNRVARDEAVFLNKAVGMENNLDITSSNNTMITGDQE